MTTKSKLKIKPLADRVVIKQIEDEMKTKSGIVLPDNAKEKPQQGEVIAVGPGRVLDNGERLTPEVKEGDIVFFSKYSGDEIKVDGVEYKIIEERNILAIL
ncbi:MAG: co-chaperone GroES [Candidatus Margulisbacteria bacterium]|nr:co-chaperone GroES [Candidatus Margulisiibacteriota bacterium]